MNVSEIARKLKITPDELREALPSMGFDIGKRAIKVPDFQVEKIVQAYQSYRRRRQMEEEERIFQEMRLKKMKEVGGEGVSMLLPEQLTVRQLSDTLGLPVAKVMSELMRNGIMATINQTIDYETASIISGDLGYSVAKGDSFHDNSKVDAEKRKSLSDLISLDSADSKLRPPVVVVMGHVDHGKTSLLDKIRSTSVVTGESGGITQHIGAYQVETQIKNDKEKRKITFLDTPGHEAFSSMRSRGGRVADIAILVVAADDGIKPQTIESLEIIQKEEIPFIVAINKIDKPEANIDRVKTALVELNVIPEEYGGTAIMVPISAKSGEGIDKLLEMVALLADMKQIKADYNREGIGTVIESKVNKDDGVLATVIVQTGVMVPGDMIIAGSVTGKIRSLKDYTGKQVAKATPGMPVQLFGLKDAPQVGDVLQVIRDRKVIKEMMKKLELEQLHKMHAKSSGSKSTELKIIVVADVSGTMEALQHSISEIKVGDKGKIKIVKTMVGSVTEALITEAEALDSIVLVFKAPISSSVEVLAKEKKVVLLKYDVIYDLLNEVEKRLREIITPDKIRKDIGKVKVLAIFRSGPKDMIIGVAVTDGLIRANTFATVMRGTKFITKIKIDSVQMGKEAVGEMSKGSECGLKITGDPVLEQGDYLDVYVEEEEKIS